VVDAPQLVPPPSRSPSPEMLSSDDEDNKTNNHTPYTLRNLPDNFPALPPKHTYHQTPVSTSYLMIYAPKTECAIQIAPPKRAALPSLEKKLKTAGLVQESLRNLMLATEDRSGHIDSELLGHTINWESSVHPRKRWKFSA
jgi:transcription initiation factor TFIID subunit 8